MKTELNKYSCTTNGSFIKIFIEGILHIAVKQKDVIGIQNWKEADNHYCIEIYTLKNSILCEYDNKGKWTSIITLLNNAI